MDRPATHPLRARLLAWLLAAPLTMAFGCQSGNQEAYRDIYLRELRLQEDEIYRLEDCIQEYQGVIRKYRVELDQLKSQAGDADTTAVPRTKPAPRAPGRSLLDEPSPPRRLESPDERDEPSGAPQLDVPAIDLGEPMGAPPAEAAPSDEPPPLDFGPADTDTPAGGSDDIPPIDIPPLDTPLDAPPLEGLPAEPAPTPDSRYESSEELPPLGASTTEGSDAPRWGQTSNATPAAPLGGLTVDGYAGPLLDSGEATLVTLIRPRTLLGEPSRFEGQASLMLIDPNQGEDGAKLARWDFSAEEVASSWRADAPQPLLDLAVVLPEGIPHDRELELWVRLVDEPHDRKVLDQAAVTLGRLADLADATLAAASQGEAPTGDAGASDEGGWRPSDRAAAVVAERDTVESGWRQSDQPSEPRKIRLATHETPLPTPPKAKTAAPAGEGVDWSPTR